MFASFPVASWRPNSEVSLYNGKDFAHAGERNIPDGEGSSLETNRIVSRRRDSRYPGFPGLDWKGFSKQNGLRQTLSLSLFLFLPRSWFDFDQSYVWHAFVVEIALLFLSLFIKFLWSYLHSERASSVFIDSERIEYRKYREENCVENCRVFPLRRAGAPRREKKKQRNRAIKSETGTRRRCSRGINALS